MKNLLVSLDRLADFDEIVDVRTPLEFAEDHIPGALNVGLGTPVMVLDRVVQDLDGRPVEWRLGWCHVADKYYLAEMA